MTTTREAALEAALREITRRQKSILADISSAHSNRGAGASGWMREDDMDFMSDLEKAFAKAEDALSTPATEPQGLVENDTIDSFCLTLRRLVSDAYAERDRFGQIGATIRVNALHYGATNAEVDAMLSGEISFVNWIADKVETRPAPQPAADTRLVPAWQLKQWSDQIDTLDPYAAMIIQAEIRAIIGTATPAPSDKIAEAARAAHDALWELNPDNYTHEDVVKQND